MRDKPNRRQQSRRIALGGLMSALALLLMLLGGILPFATFSAPVFAGILLVPVAIELGTKTALIAYLAVGILALLLGPDREMSLVFIALAGYYPLLQPYLGKIKSLALRYIVKLLIFLISMVIVYGVMYLLVGPVILEEFTYTIWMPAAALLLGTFTFFMYDLMIDRLRLVYMYKWRKRFFK